MNEGTKDKRIIYDTCINCRWPISFTILFIDTYTCLLFFIQNSGEGDAAAQGENQKTPEQEGAPDQVIFFFTCVFYHVNPVFLSNVWKPVD